MNDIHKFIDWFLIQPQRLQYSWLSANQSYRPTVDLDVYQMCYDKLINNHYDPYADNVYRKALIYDLTIQYWDKTLNLFDWFDPQLQFDIKYQFRLWEKEFWDIISQKVNTTLIYSYLRAFPTYGLSEEDMEPDMC
jgi:hypothetical protein